MDMEHTVSAFALVFAAALISTILLFIEVMRNMEDDLSCADCSDANNDDDFNKAYTPDKDLFYNVVFCNNIYDYGELVESNRLV